MLCGETAAAIVTSPWLRERHRGSVAGRGPQGKGQSPGRARRRTCRGTRAAGRGPTRWAGGPLAPYHRRVTRYPDGFDVEGPVQAEVFVVWLNGDHLELTGPCGPAPWLLELAPTDHPVEVVDPDRSRRGW